MRCGDVPHCRMPVRRREGLLLALLALSAGCPLPCNLEEVVSYPSASGRWAFDASRLQFDPCASPGGPDWQEHEAMLAGTRWCPEIGCPGGSDCENDLDDEVLAACYDASIAGPALLDGPCLEFTGGGEVLWTFTPKPCTYPGIFLPEQITLHSAAPPEIHGRLVSYLDTMGREYLVPERDEFPADLEPPADAGVLKIAADEPVHVSIDLRAGERRVAWIVEDAQLVVDPLHGPEPEVTLGERSTVLLRAQAGSEAALSLVVGDTVVPLGRVLAVPAQALAELELVVGYGRDDDFSLPMPVAARAVVRDREGDIVYGARARWEVLEGSFPLEPFTYYDVDANHDYISLLSNEDEDTKAWCFTLPDSGSRDYTGRIAARVGELSAEVELAWTLAAVPPEDLEDLFGDGFADKARPDCHGPGFPEEGCACRGGAPDGPAATLLALLALGTARRRRPRRRRVHAP